MTKPRFLVHRRALLSYEDLTTSERNALETKIAPLVDLPPEKWNAAGVIRLNATKPLYLLRIDDSLRAFVQPGSGGQPEILDFVRHETLELFFKGEGAAVSASET